MTTENRIVRDPNVMFGKPVVRGTRVTVEQILRELGDGATVAEVVVAHAHLAPEDVHAAQAFAAAYLAGEEPLPAE